MALTIGDGPNRGKSAPPPGRSKPPKQSASAQRLSREFTQRISERNEREKTQGWNPNWLAPRPALIEPRNEVHFSVQPALTAIAPRVAEQITGTKNTIFGNVFEDNPGSTFVPPPKPKPLPALDFAPRAADDGRTLDEATAEVWGNLANEGAAGLMKRQRGESTLDPGQQRAQIVQNVADQYNVKARLGRRDQARMNREKADRGETSRELTTAQWNKLSPMQQAAVQANVDLMQAVKRDFTDQGKHGNDPNKGGNARIKAYQDQVAKIFGEGELDAGTGYKGLEYAPNTIAFLDKRGIDREDLAGKTLDDLISGDALIDMDTVKNLAKPTANDSRARNVTFAKNLAAGQLRYQENLAKQLKRGDQLLTELTGRDTSKAAIGSYGAKGMGEPKFPAIQPETQQLFGTYMEILSRKDSDPAEALKAMHDDFNERGISDEERYQVNQALIEQAREATTGSPWFDGVDFPMRTPAEVAQILGGVTLKREGAK